MSVALADNKTYDRYMFASYDAITPTAPSLLNVIDAGHAEMLAFGPYSASDVATIDAATKLYLFSNWSIDTTGCIPNVPYTGTCFVPGFGTLAPYKSNFFAS